MPRRNRRLLRFAWAAVPVLATALASAGNEAPPPGAAGSVRFAVVGDYGGNTAAEAAVAALIKGWNPDLVITTGDNNYPAGAADTIDLNIGQYYHEFISPYAGAYGPGAATNRFFPSLGNHDWVTPGAAPYLAYFTLPGNERYYEFARGPVRFFALDTDPHEPDGIDAGSVQASWLRGRLAAASEVWKIVYGHHPPHSSGPHGSQPALQWPYQAWGATAVLAGHDHTYERIVLNGFPYLVNGLGGQSIYSPVAPVAGSRVFYNGDYGAMLVDADPSALSFRFVAVDGTVVDTYTIPAPVFADVTGGVYRPAIEALVRAGVVAGCRVAGGTPFYCPGAPVTRAEVAIFLLRGARGGEFTPPEATGDRFVDVPAAHWAASWIEALASEGVTAGCAVAAYCPADAVTRAQMAVLLLRARYGAGYTPPPAAGGFGDVPASHWAAAWIEEIAREGITAGCRDARYCPADPVTREQMAVFVTRAFGIPVDAPAREP